MAARHSGPGTPPPVDGFTSYPASTGGLMKELLAKFRLLAGGAWDEETVQRIIDTVGRLDELESITGLAGLLSAPAQEGHGPGCVGGCIPQTP